MTTVKELAKELNISRSNLTQILNRLGRKGYYKDSLVVEPGIIEEVKAFIEANKETGTQSMLPPSNDEKQDVRGVLSQKEDIPSGQEIQLNPHELAVIQSAQARGELLADMASAVFANSFLEKETSHQIAFARLYLDKFNKELTGLSGITEKDLLSLQSNSKLHQEEEMDFLKKQQDSLKEKSLSLKGKYQLTPYF